MRILGLDVGDKRIGCAISDEEGKIAFGLDTIETKDAEKSLKSFFLKYNPGMIVCGIPLTLKGERNDQAKKVLEFIKRLKRITNIPIALWDERLSTKEAERILKNLSHKKRKKLVDMLSSQLILQGFLDKRKNEGA